MTRALLPGAVEYDLRDKQIRDLQNEVARLHTELHTAIEERDQGNQAIAACATLRRQLEPLHRALRAVFGELDAFSVTDIPGASAVSGPSSPVWESWKDTLGRGSGAAKFIDALLQHRELNAAQLRVHMKCSNQHVYDTATKLNKLGLLLKNGGKYSLRQAGG